MLLSLAALKGKLSERGFHGERRTSGVGAHSVKLASC
jgi:hypothetical protein